MTLSLLERVDACVRAIRAKAPEFQPKQGIILGSGLGGFADALERPVAIDCGTLPDFPMSRVPGHLGRLVLGWLGATPVVAVQGRVHLYEGYLPWQVAFSSRVLCRFGISHLTVTNTAGGIHPHFSVGDFMAVSDHLNLTACNPLIGFHEDGLGPGFLDMSAAYNFEARQLLRRVASIERIPLREGVYAGMAGPSYETPAEIQMLRALGADAVGMSTVLEVIAAAHMGVRVTGISCITNLAAGVGQHKLSHDEVIKVTNQAKTSFMRLAWCFLDALSHVA